jgi:nucleoid-associated protein YgaU
VSIEKLTITYDTDSTSLDPDEGTLTALFNPSQLVYSKTVKWKKDNPLPEGETQSWTTVYDSTEQETLTVSLFFDVYEKVALWKLNPIARFTQSKPNVLKYTKKLADLARFVKNLHGPPACLLTWGKVEIFTGVLTSLKQTYTLFDSDGTPIRATADCTFLEIAMDWDKTRYELNSPDVDKTHVVRPGDTLDMIAAKHYEDRTQWRVIADANRIDNPRRLTPGQILHIPKLR